MTRTLAAAFAIAAAASVPASAAQPLPGPFVGVVQTGQTNTHVYGNEPPASSCPLVITTYSVTLRWVPASDTLTLSVGSVSVTSNTGFASFTLTRSFCTTFSISVRGESVRTAAAYVLDVMRGSPA
jgi:hypothetical protein